MDLNLAGFKNMIVEGKRCSADLLAERRAVLTTGTPARANHQMGVIRHPLRQGQVSPSGVGGGGENRLFVRPAGVLASRPALY